MATSQLISTLEEYHQNESCQNKFVFLKCEVNHLLEMRADLHLKGITIMRFRDDFEYEEHS
jgi:hypothetical protein